MKIGVTGASGHIGNNLCRMLIKTGHTVRVMIHDGDEGLAGLPVERIPGDVVSRYDLENFCWGCDVIYHLAAYISIRRKDQVCDKINIEGCLNLIHAARQAGIRKIIHFSSIHAFKQTPHHQELDETRELSFDSAFSYDRSKAVSQQIMLEASTKKMEIVVLNPTGVIGPNDFEPSLLGRALIRFYKGQNPVLIPGGFNWVDVRDICSAAIHAIERGTGGTCYILGGSWKDLKTLSQTIENLGGHKAPRIELPHWIARLGLPLINLQSGLSHHAPLYTGVSLETLKNGHRKISSARANSTLDFCSRPFEDTLSDTLAWYHENSYL